MLQLTLTKANVVQNRETIDARIAELNAEIAACRGLHAANQTVCPHKHKYDIYDPGYAGGGHDGYRCDDCGKRGYF